MAKENDKSAIILEVNSETDFVAQNAKFLDLIDSIATSILNSSATNAAEALEVKTANGTTVAEELISATATIGEKIELRRIARVEKTSDNTVVLYNHSNKRVSVLLGFKGTMDQGDAYNVAMHVAAMAPVYKTQSEIPTDFKDAEMHIIRENSKEDPKLEGKPANIIENILNGKLAKRLSEISLADQSFVVDESFKNQQLKTLGYDKVRVYSSLPIKTVTDDYNFKQARIKLNEGYVSIFVGGTGFSYFTTDTNAVIRAIEINADAVLMAKNGVKGVYDKDPRTNADAKFFSHLTYDEIAKQELRVMDLTAATLAKEAKMTIEVFDMQGKNNIIKEINMIQEIIKHTKDEMEKVTISLKEHLGKIRTGRANANMLETVMINYYGSMTPLNQTAQISVPEPHLIVVKPYDRNLVSEVVGGIHKADLGLNPVSDAEVVRISIPPLTEEIRKELVKKMHKELEPFKVRIRNIRRDGIEMAKKNKDISEDLVKDAEKEIQILTDQFIKEIDNLAKEKEKDLLSL
ncbi:hypothetical protein FQA39_LY12841 [Lamprigera yunnana]|nr:hypothetical protein FQA39_LY12841 [Lamprigera yunnana]